MTALACAIEPQLLKTVGKLCTYPDSTFHETIRNLLEDWPEAPESHRYLLAHFYKDTVHMDLAEIEQCYTATFEVNPVCTPYISVYLFGQESFKRAEFMVGLLESYERIGLSKGTELPDHIGFILQALPDMPHDEQFEMVSYCLRSPLNLMEKSLTKTLNPYHHIIALACESIDILYPRENRHD